MSSDIPAREILAESPSGLDLANELGIALNGSINSPESDQTLPSMSAEHQSPLADSDPAISALVASMVEARLQEVLLQHRAQEADLINREINSRKAIEELRAKLTVAENKNVAGESGIVQAGPSVPANAPRKRRRNSTATVPDVSATPVRSTRSSARIAAVATSALQSLPLEPILIADPQSNDVALDPPSLPILYRDETMPLVQSPLPLDPQSLPILDRDDSMSLIQPPLPEVAAIAPDSLADRIPRQRRSTRRHNATAQHSSEIPPPVAARTHCARPTPAPSSEIPPPLAARTHRARPTPAPSSEIPPPVAARTHRARPTPAPFRAQTIPAPVRTQPAMRREPRTVVKAAGEIYRFLPQDMPPDMDGLKKAMDIHIRILWALLDSKAVPRDPPTRVLNIFNLQFSNMAELHTSQDSGPELIPRRLVQVGTLMSSFKGGIARQARLVEEHILQYIQVRLARLGLDRWCPDLRQTPYSLYNSACRIVALDTFKQALACHTYQHLQPNVSYAQDLEVLSKLFDHFVFYYMYSRYQQEKRNPGSVEQDAQDNTLYKGRVRLSEARLQFLKENGYPKRYRDLIDPKATSDDELAEGGSVRHIKRRPERSMEAEHFIRILDAKREEYSRQSKSRRWKERARIVPPDQRDSDFKVLPDHMPVDYFDPTFFNQLQPRTRNRVADRRIAFLPDIANSLTWCADERLRDSTFTRLFGPPIFERYDMVSDDDVRALAGASGDDRESLGDDEGEGDWIDDDEPRSTDEEGEWDEEEEEGGEEGEGVRGEEEAYSGTDMSISTESIA